MRYVIEIHKEIGTNTFNTTLVHSTDSETDAKLLTTELENAFDTFKLRKRTTYRSDGNFKFIYIELKRG